MVLDSLRAADRAQLCELYARTAVLLELGRCREWVELFDSRATVRSVQASAGRCVEHRFEGRDQLLRLAEQIARGEFDIAVGDLTPPSRVRHFIGNICLIEEQPHYVSGVAHVAVMSVGLGEPRWVASGAYSDRLHRCSSGCWCFQSRTFTADAAAAIQFGRMSSADLARSAAHP